MRAAVRRWWERARALWRATHLARERRRRVALVAGCCGSMSDRWLQAHHYASGKRREV